MNESTTSSVVIQELLSIVGSDFLYVDTKNRELYSRSTLSKGTTPDIIIKPKDKKEVQKIVKLASKYNLKIHPISTGKNWGYTDACAPKDEAILVDLSRMNTILEVNEDMCYATIEPGVTQGQLYDFLNHKKINLWMDATGAGPDTSIIGNITERGFGHSPYGDRYAHSCAYEVILPTGEILTTGFGHYKNSKISELYKWGIGPSVDGLFTQSNLGIVTKMTIWLLPRPEDFQVLFFILKDEKDIVDFIEKVRPLKIDGTIQSTVHISNDLRTISTLQRFPFDEVGTNRYLSKEERRSLLNKYKLGFWVGTMGFYGSKKQNKADLELVRKKIKSVQGIRILVVDSILLSFLKKCIYIINIFSHNQNLIILYKKIKISFDLLQGKTPNSSTQGGLWKIKKDTKEKEIVTNNPLDHESGFYWISPILPMKGDDVQKLTDLVEPIFNTYGFDFLQTLSMVSERSLCSVMTICFDKKNIEETRKAEACHNKIVGCLIEHGYILYRAGNQTMNYLTKDSETFFEFLKKIKDAVDPSHTFSPGKYIPD